MNESAQCESKVNIYIFFNFRKYMGSTGIKTLMDDDIKVILKLEREEY